MSPLLLKKKLERVHQKFVESHEVQNDAIAPALRFKNKKDKECVAFICAVLAYGRVDQIKKSIVRLITPLGSRPTHFLSQVSVNQLKQITGGFKHRFNGEQDAQVLLWMLRQVYQEFGSLEELIKPSVDHNAEKLIENLVEGLSQLDLSEVGGLPAKGSSFWFLLPRPSSGSACKRLNLFLRWMVGKSEMDLNLWKSVSTKQLIIPVDVHVLRQSRRLGLTKRKQADWKTAEEITASLRRLDPMDPTRFDFAICHMGIRGE